ncbi:MAG: TIR domain-containing protein [Candidatus Levyibacteriota bacterium]
MGDPEKRYLTNLKVVLGNIKAELLHTASSRPLRYQISNLIAAGWPSRREEIEIFYKLEEEGVLEVNNETQHFFEIKVDKERFDEKYAEIFTPITKASTSPKSQVEEYDLAFSFAGEDRTYVEEVKAECDELGLVTYYDKDRKIDQWGESFISEQRKVYSGYKTKHFVPFISQHYFSKQIPTDEFKSALLESTKRKRYILPIKIDNSDVSVEYLHRDVQYLKKEDYTPKQLAYALKKIVDETNTPAKDIEQLLEDALDLPLPKVIPRTYSKYEEAELLISYIAEKFEKNLPKLRTNGYAPIVRKKGDDLMILVERDGKTLFVLNIFFSHMGSSEIGYNFDQRSNGNNSENGHIIPSFEKETQKTGYILNDYGNFGDKKFSTKDEIVKFFWDKMNQDLEYPS